MQVPSLATIWLVLAYLLVHTLLSARSRINRRVTIQTLLINAIFGSIFTLLLWRGYSLTEAPQGFERLVLLWGPVLFFWWAYRWSERTLTAVHSPEFKLDPILIRWEAKWLGQPSLHWARRGGPILTEILHLFYFSYYFYTPILGIYLFTSGKTAAFESMTFSVCLGYLVSYTFFSLTPAEGPRWSLVESGQLDPSEQQLKGYLITRFTNLIMFRGPAIKGGAMPSSHSSTAVVFLIWCWRCWGPEAGLLAGLVAAGMWVASVYGRYHFVTDVAAGAALGFVSVFLGDWVVG